MSTTTPSMQAIARKIKPMLKTMTYKEAALALHKQGIKTPRSKKKPTADFVNYIVSNYINH